MYYPYTAGVAALSHFYFNPLYFKPVGLFVEENQRPRQDISLQQGQQADEGTENQAVFHGEAEQVGFFAFQTDCRAGDGDGLRRNHFAGHAAGGVGSDGQLGHCLLYTSPSPRDRG